MIARALIFLVRGYRLLLSPWLGSACRFAPTCSVYAIEALSNGAVASGTTVSNTGLLLVSSGGLAVGTIITASGA